MASWQRVGACGDRTVQPKHRPPLQATEQQHPGRQPTLRPCRRREDEWPRQRHGAAGAIQAPGTPSLLGRCQRFGAAAVAPVSLMAARHGGTAAAAAQLRARVSVIALAASWQHRCCRAARSSSWHSQRHGGTSSKTGALWAGAHHSHRRGAASIAAAPFQKQGRCECRRSPQSSPWRHHLKRTWELQVPALAIVIHHHGAAGVRRHHWCCGCLCSP
mmetsp:Transcript_30344/g.90008  ORF Transcript_30344/g.90008 Transcript_30344/m.90008 type:complete len:217 (-) Transcript_30344:402-1052(-)